MLWSKLLSRGSSCVVKPVYATLGGYKPVHFFKTSCVGLGQIKVGDRASISKAFSAAEVKTFSEISLDKNPIHLDPEFAKNTRFGKPIVHGVLCFGLLSGVLGTKLPGEGSVMLACTFETPAPLYIGESITAEVTVKEIVKRKVSLDMRCYTEDNKTVAQGVTHLLVPKHML